MNARRFFSLLGIVGSSLALFASTAQAQDALPPADTTAEAPATPATPPSASATTPLPPPPPAPVASCSVGAVRGLPQEDAVTAAWLVCEEVHAYGEAPRPASVSSDAGPVVYRVDLAKLGTSVVVTLSAVSPSGARLDSRRLSVTGLAEVAVAAPRLAEALMQGRALKQTQTVSNLVSSETRTPLQKHTQFMVGGGVAGTLLPGTGKGVAAGLNLRAGFELERVGVVGNIMFGSTDDNDKGNASYVGLGVGARYFLTDSDFTPFVGGGMTWSGISSEDYLSTSSYSSYRDRSGSGVGAYGEVGLEMLRTTSGRLSLDLRVETPFYSIKDGDQYTAPYAPADVGSLPAEAPAKKDDSTYVVPVSLGLVYTFGS